MIEGLTNPFIIDRPVPASKFVGRRKEIDIILSQLANPASRGSSAINGEHKIGKTSLLCHIATPDIAARWGLSPDHCTFVSVDSQTIKNYMRSHDIVTFTESIFWHCILRSLKMYEICNADLENLLEQQNSSALDIQPLFSQIAAEHKLVVLLLDEFEWIIANILKSQQPNLLYSLRSLINRPVEIRGLALVIASQEPLADLCRDIQLFGSPLDTSLTTVQLKPFSKSEADKLIDEYLKDTVLQFTDQDKSFVYEVSKGNPYWLQNACSKLFQRYMEKATL